MDFYVLLYIAWEVLPYNDACFDFVPCIWALLFSLRCSWLSPSRQLPTIHRRLQCQSNPLLPLYARPLPRYPVVATIAHAHQLHERHDNHFILHQINFTAVSLERRVVTYH